MITLDIEDMETCVFELIDFCSKLFWEFSNNKFYLEIIKLLEVGVKW